MHPDPAGLAAVDPTNPQSWNLYAYVKNNPLNLVDPLGLGDCPDLKIGCMPSNECQDGVWVCGAPGVDLFGGRWSDVWGGDAATQNRMALLAVGLVSNFDIQEITKIAYGLLHVSSDGYIDNWDNIPIIYPYAGLEKFLWYDSTGQGRQGHGGHSRFQGYIGSMAQAKADKHLTPAIHGLPLCGGNI